MYRSTSAALTPAVDYERHRPEGTPLYGIVETYYPQFLTRLEADGGSLPAFVKAFLADASVVLIGQLGLDARRAIGFA